MKTYDKHSYDYQCNIASLEEMEYFIPMTLRERRLLRQWVRCGNEPESNPWNYVDTDGCPMNFLQAYRLRYGYLHGPWDSWKGPDLTMFWDDDEKCLRSPDNL